MAASYRIREAVLDDNERLLELVRRCPIKGIVQVVMDRQPDYFALTRLQGDRSTIYVAENDQSEIVGSVALIEKTERRGSSEFKVLRFSDLRTDPAYRNSRIAARFIEMYRQKLINEGYDYGTAEILEGNQSPIKAQRLLGDAIAIVPEGFLEIYQLVPLWTFRPNPDYLLRRARISDIPALAELLGHAYSDSSGAPLFSEAGLDELTQQHGSFRLDDIWLAEDKDGQIVASIGTWDQKGLRRTVALRFSRSVRFVVRLLALLGLLWRLPPPPTEGGLLRFIYLRWPACRRGAEPALRALIRHVMGEVRAQGEHQFVAIGFHEKDPLKLCLRGIVRIKSRMHLFSHQVKARSSHSTLPASAEEYKIFVDPALV